MTARNIAQLLNNHRCGHVTPLRRVLGGIGLNDRSGRLKHAYQSLPPSLPPLHRPALLCRSYFPSYYPSQHVSVVAMLVSALR